MLWTIEELMHLTRDELLKLTAMIELNYAKLMRERSADLMHSPVSAISAGSWSGAVCISDYDRKQKCPCLWCLGRGNLSKTSVRG